MTLSLKDSQAVVGMANVLYSFLPNSTNSQWKNHITFRTIADKAGVGEFWQSGSKRPALTALLERTLDKKRSHFQNLIIEIVRAGISYRQRNGAPVTLNEIQDLNKFLLNVSFKFPELWDQSFLDSLARGSESEVPPTEDAASVARRLRSDMLSEIRTEFFALYSEEDRNAAGLKLEGILNRMFEAYGLHSRQAFRVVGEQIDGSFELDHNIYLLEAKWERDPLPESPLLEFRGKIEGKSSFTRGLFVALNGVSDQCKVAIIRGKQPTFFVIDGYDLTMLLSEEISLIDFLRQRLRLLAEEGLMFVPYSQLAVGSRRT